MEMLNHSFKSVAEVFREKEYEDVYFVDGSKPTPYEVTEEIFEKLDYNTTDRFLVLFDWTMVFKARQMGVTDVTLVLNTITKRMKQTAFNMGIRLKSYEEVQDLKFDVVIGNPPYQNVHGAKRWPLWHQFVNKATKISENVALVVPASLVGPGKAFKDVKDKLKTLSLDVDKHFNVGSTFCYFVYDKNHKGNTQVISDEKVFDLDLSDIDFLPLKVNDRSLKLLNKLNGNRVWKRGEYHTSDKDWQSSEGVVVHHTNAQTLYSNKQHENLNKVRVCVTLSGYPKFKVLQNEGCSQVNFWTEFTNLQEAEEFAEKCNGPEIQEIVSTLKWSGWNSKEVISKL